MRALLPLLLMLAGCTGDAERTVFETMENAGQQQCLHQRNPAECTQRGDYDRYQKERKALEKNSY